MSILTRDEDVGRTIVRPRGGCHFESCRDAHHDVASAGAQSVAEETAPLRPPRVLDALAHVLREQFGNFVFETFAALIRERKIVWVRADAQHARRSRDHGWGYWLTRSLCLMRATRTTDYTDKKQSQELRRHDTKEARRHTTCLPSSCGPAGRSSHR